MDCGPPNEHGNHRFDSRNYPTDSRYNYRAMIQARLRVLSGPAQGGEFDLADAEFTIGRDGSNSLPLADSTVSRRHCVIARQGPGFRLRDLGSANCTRINGQPVEEAWLANRDQIVVGKSRFAFALEDRDAPQLQQEETLHAQSTVTLQRAQARYLQPAEVLEGPAGSPQLPSHIRSLLRAASSISSAADPRAFGKALIESLTDTIRADRGALVLEDGAPEGYYWTRRGAPDTIFQPPRSVIRRVLDEGVSICLNDILRAEEDVSASVRAARINSIVAAPIGDAGRTLGVLYLDVVDITIRLSEDDLQLATGVAALGATPLSNLLRLSSLEAENQRLEEELRGHGGMVGESPRARDVYSFIRRAAPSGSTVLILGESGTGKELVARALHRNSPRSSRPFVAINCAAITESLIESEFFGHEKGAFTGALGVRRGKLEEADGGTVFLDEIGELAPVLQAKLLRVLQEREFERVGGARTIRIDIRVIAATNRDLAEIVRKGGFRQDLFYRLNVVSVTLPPLRERRADILPLAHYFLETHRGRAARMISGLSNEARSCFMSYDWPGNIRELQNAIEHAVVLGTTPEILPEDLPDSVVQTGEAPPGGKFHETIRDFKRQIVTRAMEDARQNYTEAARMLGLHPNNLHRLMKTLGLK